MGNKITISLLDYADRGTGLKNWASVFAAAVSHLQSAGGGTLRVPAGEYRTGTVRLYSGITLHLEENARIIGSPDLNDYETIQWGHNPDRTPWHLIVAENAQGVSILGEGTIDGSGPHFWEQDPYRPGYPGGFVKAHKERRPSPMVELVNCSDVRLEGVLLTRSPGWTLHLHDCSDVSIRNIRIENSFWGPNTDGIDLTGVHNVTIEGCSIRTGDDGICLKTTGDSRDVRNVTVRNCHIRSYCAALKLGCVESVRDMRDILFEDCRIEESSRMLAIYSYRGARIENVTARRISRDTRAPLILNRPIQIEARLDYPDDSQPDGFVHDPQTRPPYIRNISVEDFDAETDGRIMLVGSDGLEVSGLKMRNLKLRYPCVYNAAKTGAGAASRQFALGAPKARVAMAAIVADGIRDSLIEHVAIEWPLPPARQIPPDWDFPLRFENGSWKSFPAEEDDYAFEMSPLRLSGSDAVTISNLCEAGFEQ